MNRGEMRDEVEAVVEDASNATFEVDKIDRALNRAARHISSVIARKAGIFYAGGTFSLSATADTLAYPVNGVDDLRQVRYLRPPINPTGALGRNIVGGISSVKACLIPEHQRYHPEYRTGINSLGETVAYMTYNSDHADEVVTLTVSGGPSSGTWEVSYGGQTSAAALAIAATAAEVQTALQSLSTIGSGNATVAGSAGGPWTVTFAGDLKRTNATAITTTDSFDAGQVDVAVVTEGSPPWSVNFIAAVVGDWELVYVKSDRVIAPGVDATNDALTYDTIPDVWHDVTVFYAALSLLGIHDDKQSPINAEFGRLLREMTDSLSVGHSSGKVRQELWR